MNESLFCKMLEEIYGIFGKMPPAKGSPTYGTLFRHLGGGKYEIPSEAAKEIAYAFIEYDSCPQNMVKAMRNELSKWRQKHPEKIIKRQPCPKCDPKTAAGFVWVHDKNGKNYVLRCVCNQDSLEWSSMPVATSEFLTAHGLELGYLIVPPQFSPQPHDGTTKEQLYDRLAKGSTAIRPEHIRARQEAGMYDLPNYNNEWE